MEKGIVHPNLQESLIMVGSAMVFTLEKWDEFIAMVGMTQDEANEVKPLYEHITTDMHAHIEINELIADGLSTLAILFAKKVKKNGE